MTRTAVAGIQTCSRRRSNGRRSWSEPGLSSAREVDAWDLCGRGKRRAQRRSGDRGGGWTERVRCAQSLCFDAPGGRGPTYRRRLHPRPDLLRAATRSRCACHRTVAGAGSRAAPADPRLDPCFLSRRSSRRKGGAASMTAPGRLPSFAAPRHRQASAWKQAALLGDGQGSLADSAMRVSLGRSAHRPPRERACGMVVGRSCRRARDRWACGAGRLGELEG